MSYAAQARAPETGVLTPKEHECLTLVARHMSSKEIARELGISKASVDTYCNRARAKLGVASRRAAALLVAGSPGAAPARTTLGHASPSDPSRLAERAQDYLRRAMEAERKAALGNEELRREMIDLAMQWRDLARVTVELASSYAPRTERG